MQFRRDMWYQNELISRWEWYSNKITTSFCTSFSSVHDETKYSYTCGLFSEHECMTSQLVITEAAGGVNSRRAAAGLVYWKLIEVGWTVPKSSDGVYLWIVEDLL